MQAVFSFFLILFVSLTTTPLITVQSQAQLIFGQQGLQLDHDIIAFFFLDMFEYTFELEGTQIFPNDTIKHTIVSEYRPSSYNIPTLEYEIMDHAINASFVEIHVEPTRIDETHTRLDFQIHAQNAEIIGPWLGKNYNNLEIKSAYSIYDLVTDKMTVHIPYTVALQHLLQ
jgi:hypothetical protein